MTKLSRVLRFCSVLLIFCALALHAGSQKPVIIDTDIGDDIDDTWALALALRCPELNIKLVLGDYGKPEYRARLIAKLLDVGQRTDIPVGLGIEHGKGQQERQAEWVSDYPLTKYPGKVHQDGVGAMIETIMQSRERITLLAIGPVPNLAEALRREPRIAKKVDFVGMYGSVRMGYGHGSKPAAEWNVKADVPSCQKVFSAPWKMTITPLDTCGIVQLDEANYAIISGSSQPLARAVVENYNIWSRFNDSKKKQNESETVSLPTRSSTLFDCVAVYLAIDDDFCQMEQLRLIVDDQGFTREDSKGKKMKVAMAWKDLPGFEKWMINRVAK